MQLSLLILSSLLLLAYTRAKKRPSEPEPDKKVSKLTVTQASGTSSALPSEATSTILTTLDDRTNTTETDNSNSTAAASTDDSSTTTTSSNTTDNVLLQRQLDLSELFHTQPIHVPEQIQIAHSWDLEKNIDHYSNVTAVKILVELYEDSLLPRGSPFTIHEKTHRFEVETIFNVLYSAKKYETFYKTAAWLRSHVNENLFVYVLSVAIVHRPDTQGIVLPRIYEIFPSYFHNAEILTTAQRINTHGLRMVEHYPSTYVWQNNVVIKSNMTIWPYQTTEEMRVNYFTHDQGLNAFYYNWHLTYPLWLGGEVAPLVKDKRGEWFWFLHKQLLSLYYMERLSNGLGEIPELSWDVPVQTGVWPGLQHYNGIPYPARPTNFILNQPQFVEELQFIKDWERRVRDAIELGFVINNVGEQISTRNHEAIDILGRIIESNIDSPNHKFYGDFISGWKQLLGNSIEHKQYNELYHKNIPLVLPSILEHYQTAVRDTAFWMIWKRVMNIFALWQEHLPLYKREELALPGVNIKDVEVDELSTYFENNRVNVTNHLNLNGREASLVQDDVSVLVEGTRLNHKIFQVRVKVNSESAKTVVVRMFLAPKYDSDSNEIPLIKNWQNFFLLDQFNFDLIQGENVIKRDSTQNLYTIEDWLPANEVYEKAELGLHGKTPVVLDLSHRLDGFPQYLVLPKGRASGMPFVVLVSINEYRAPKVPLGQGVDSTVSLGLGSGARHPTDDPLGFPLNRPIYDWQIKNLNNIWMENVLIYHKHTPEIVVSDLD